MCIRDSFCGHSVVLTRDGEDSLCDDPAASLRQQKVSDTQNRVALVNGCPDGRLISIHQNTLPDVYKRQGEIPGM